MSDRWRGKEEEEKEEGRGDKGEEGGETHPRARRDSHPDPRSDRGEWEEERKQINERATAWRGGRERKKGRRGREKNNSKKGGKKREKEKRGSAFFNFVPGDSKDAALGWCVCLGGGLLGRWVLTVCHPSLTRFRSLRLFLLLPPSTPLSCCFQLLVGVARRINREIVGGGAINSSAWLTLSHLAGGLDSSRLPSSPRPTNWWRRTLSRHWVPHDVAEQKAWGGDADQLLPMHRDEDWWTDSNVHQNVVQKITSFYIVYFASSTLF